MKGAGKIPPGFDDLLAIIYLSKSFGFSVIVEVRRPETRLKCNMINDDEVESL